jgi:hypothetical protein
MAQAVVMEKRPMFIRGRGRSMAPGGRGGYRGRGGDGRGGGRGEGGRLGR